MKRLDTYSQNFLRSPRLVKELIGHSTIKKSDLVLDIGAGSGVISSALAPRCKAVISYEYDSRMIKKLTDNLSRYENVTVVEKDFLKAELPHHPYKVFANIPFHLSSPILKKLTESAQRPDAIYLIVQKQFANKLAIDMQGFTGMLGAQITPTYEAKIKRRLQRTDFWPYPAVDTAFLELRRRNEQLLPENRMDAYRVFVADCFADPKVFLKMPLANVGAAGKRPSELSTAEWTALFTQQARY